MDSETPKLKQEFITHELKDEIQRLGFVLTNTPENGVMWGFDGKTKYFPRNTYIREKKDNKPKIKLMIEKTTNGFRLIINSIPLASHNHLNRSELEIQEIMPIIREYLDLI
jgi:hypothetical protein